MHYGLGYSGVPNPATATLSVDRTGIVTLRIGLGDLGQGSNTAILQMAAESLGVDMDSIRLITHDTDETVPSGPTSASRVTYFAGNAILLGAKEFLPRVLAYVTRAYGLEPADRLRVEGGAVWDGSRRVASFAEACEEALPAEAVVAEGKFDPVTSMDADGQGVPYVVYSYAAHLAEVEVDTALGTVEVVQIWAAHDAGAIVNPTVAEGQIEGGAVMGLGYALLEELVTRDGRIENPTFGGYLIPTFADAPVITPIFVDNRERTGPFGAKGLAEPSVIPVAPAIVNAIYDATGVALDRLPVHPEDLLAGLEISRRVGRPDEVAPISQ
jgi:CO/xanthine dehydrogenase Mo-binding subunit